MLNNPISDEEIAEIEHLLQSEELGDTHDYFGAHGFICGLAVSPADITEGHWLSILLDIGEKDLSNPHAEKVGKNLITLKKTIDHSLYHGEKLILPCPLKLSPKADESPLRSWAIGFMEVVLLHEANWYQRDEETIAQLLLPIILASGLHEDPEIQRLERDHKLGKTILLQIPEIIIDLYIFYRSGSVPA